MVRLGCSYQINKCENRVHYQIKYQNIIISKNKNIKSNIKISNSKLHKSNMKILFIIMWRDP